jgi:hypothetical protein
VGVHYLFINASGRRGFINQLKYQFIIAAIGLVLTRLRPLSTQHKMNPVKEWNRISLLLLCSNLISHCSCYYPSILRSPQAQTKLRHARNSSRVIFFLLKFDESKQKSSNQYLDRCSNGIGVTFNRKILDRTLNLDAAKYLSLRKRPRALTTNLLYTRKNGSNNRNLSTNFDDLSLEFRTTKSIIGDTISDSISEQNSFRQQYSNGIAHQAAHCYDIQHSEFIGTAAAPPPELTTTATIGLVDDRTSQSIPGTILPSTLSIGAPLLWQSGVTESIRDNLAVRVATALDDSAIASIRQIVFWADPNRSITKTEHSSLYHQKCCEMLEMRRRREGAICLAAVVPAAMLSSIHISLETALEFDRHSTLNRDNVREWIIGTVECSIHEFYGTQLGHCYEPFKLLYLTEVAVHPLARRCGAGMMLLQVFIYTHAFKKNKVSKLCI